MSDTQTPTNNDELLETIKNLQQELSDLKQTSKQPVESGNLDPTASDVLKQSNELYKQELARKEQVKNEATALQFINDIKTDGLTELSSKAIQDLKQANTLDFTSKEQEIKQVVLRDFFARKEILESLPAHRKSEVDHFLTTSSGNVNELWNLSLDIKSNKEREDKEKLKNAMMNGDYSSLSNQNKMFNGIGSSILKQKQTA